MTASATDWAWRCSSGLLFATGVMTLFAGQHGDAWVFAVHGVGGFALACGLCWRLRRVWRRLVRPARWDCRTAAGAGALTLVVATLVSGVGWSSRLQLSAGGYNLLGWHFALGVVLTLAVALHALLRAKPLRRRDLAGRRQFLRTGALAAGAYLVAGPPGAPGCPHDAWLPGRFLVPVVVRARALLDGRTVRPRGCEAPGVE